MEKYSAHLMRMKLLAPDPDHTKPSAESYLHPAAAYFAGMSQSTKHVIDLGKNHSGDNQAMLHPTGNGVHLVRLPLSTKQSRLVHLVGWLFPYPPVSRTCRLRRVRGKHL